MKNTEFIATLPVLDLDHPGAQDPAYKKRREQIAMAAVEFHQSSQKKIPFIKYTPEEHAVWRHVLQKLKPLHEKWACSWYKEGWRKMNIREEHIPQIREVSTQLEQINGFSLEPIHGLVQPREFLIKLSQNVMLCTQYIRHPSKPEFTPEPDIIHEVLGHVPMFTHPDINELQQMIGKAAMTATEQQLEWLNRIYWFTIEYGLICEQGDIKAFGAGLLGGIKDLTNALSGKARITLFDLKTVITTDYNYSCEQPQFFVMESLEQTKEEIRRFIESFQDP